MQQGLDDTVAVTCMCCRHDIPILYRAHYRGRILMPNLVHGGVAYRPRLTNYRQEIRTPHTIYC
jgi:hypothetical protein